MAGDNGRVLSTQFQNGRAHIKSLGKITEDLHTHIVRARESDPIHLGAFDQRLPECAPGAGDVIKDTVRQSGIPQAFCQTGAPSRGCPWRVS